MDQILPLVETLLARIDWISAGLSGLCGAVVAGFASLFARGFELEGWRSKLVWIAVAAISIVPAHSGAKAYIAPSIYEWTYQDSAIEELSKFPFYKALLDHHPESRSGLVRSPQPDPARIAPLRQMVIARMTQEGNPLITTPDQLADNPKRACFAILQALETAQKTLSREDFGAFLRATMPLFFADDDI